MKRDTFTILERHKTFITTICQTEIVFGLSSKAGFSVLNSNDFEDEKGNPVEMICFWADKSSMAFCAKNDWEQYQPEAISLSEFVENWCVGMYNDGLLAVTELDSNLFGYEIDPLGLVLEIIAELELIGKTIPLEKFESLSDLESQINIISNIEHLYK